MDKEEPFLVGPVIMYYEELLKNGKHECGNFMAACKYYVEQYPNHFGAPQQNEFAWKAFLYDVDRRDLEVALGWAKEAVDSARKDDPWRSTYFDTYSNLLYKLGNKDQALEWEEKAVSANSNPKDMTYITTLNKMKAGSPTW